VRLLQHAPASNRQPGKVGQPHAFPVGKHRAVRRTVAQPAVLRGVGRKGGWGFCGMGRKGDAADWHWGLAGV
jgi:hypothetical protein